MKIVSEILRSPDEPAGQAPPPTQEPPAPPTQTAQESPPAAAPEAPAEAPQVEPPKPEKPWYQTRIDALTREARSAQAELANLQRHIAQQQAGLRAQQPQQQQQPQLSEEEIQNRVVAVASQLVAQ